MKLYTHPGASSMHIHILLRETGLGFDFEVVNVTKKLRADGSDYRLVAPRGMVPVLQLDDGALLTENVVVSQYICDTARRTDLMPEAGSLARYRVMEWQSFVAAELHKGFSPLFWPIDDATKALVRDRIADRLGIVNDVLKDRPYLTGDTFTAADAYLFVISSWAHFFQFDFAGLPHLQAFLVRVGERPSVQAALAAEGPGLVAIQTA